MTSSFFNKVFRDGGCFQVALLLALASVSLRAPAEVLIPESCAGQGLTLENVMDPTQTPLPVLLHYRSPDHTYDNSYGDVGLLRYSLDVPWGLFWTLAGHPEKIEDFKNWIMAGKPCALQLYRLQDREIPAYRAHAIVRDATAKELNTVQNLSISAERKGALLDALLKHQLFFQGHANPIQREGFVHMVEQVIGETQERLGLEPSVGVEPTWSPRIRWNLKPEFLPILQLPKLLIAMSMGESSRYMTTGQEQPLINWILSRPLRSIEPYDLLSESFELNRANMMDTLLTIENVLSRNWRHPHRESLEQTLRLRPITNQFGDDRNLFGTWYHFFGLVLYGYAHSGWEGFVIGQTETVGSQILSHFGDEEGETQANTEGPLVGEDIRRILKTQSWKTRTRTLDYSRSSQYLNLTQSFTSDLLNWRPSDPAPHGIHPN